MNIQTPTFKILGIALCLSFLAVLSTNPVQARFSDREPHDILLSQAADLKVLVALGMDIDGVSGNRVRAYLSPKERELLVSMRYDVRVLPDRERAAHLLYHGKKSKSVKGLSYPTYGDLCTTLDTLAQSYPEICRVSDAGYSAEGRALKTMTLSDHPDQREAEPALTLVSTLHGNEPVGTVLLLELIRYLVERYDTDSRVKALVDSHEIRFLPLANPDGYEEGDRYNAQGLDLNRNFPDPSASSQDVYDSRGGRAPETLAIMDWILERPAAVSLNLHTGFMVVNYPLDYTEDPSPDDGLLQHLSLAYAANSPDMSFSPYPQGLVRGSVWYIIAGGLQDWAYLAAGELHVTVELSNEKYPPPTELDDLWNSNRESLLAYLETADTGIGGRVLDAETGLPLSAWIRIEGNGHLVFTDAMTGHYLRVLLPGDYTCIVGAPGYVPQTWENVPVTDGTVSVRDVLLEKGEDPVYGDVEASNWPSRVNPEEGEDATGGSGGVCFIGASF